MRVGEDMKIKTDKVVYAIWPISSNNFAVCLILDEFTTQEQANSALVDLLSGAKKPQDLLDNYKKKKDI